MSRCFPFPPPGYEAKPRSEHKDLLKKEKHKEKKHKKERKHRERTERKEKDRDHRKDKHSKKHERERHRDRRKDKGRGEVKKRKWERRAQKNDDIGNRRPKQRMLNELVKDIKPTDDLVTQSLGQEGHANGTGSSKVLPRSNESFDSADYKENERISISRVVEKSAHTIQCNNASDKGNDTGHGSKTGIWNRKGLQGVSAEKHSSTRGHKSNGVNLQQERYFAQRTHEGVASTMNITGGERGLNGRIAPNSRALQRTEQVGQQIDSSSHSTYGSTKGVMEKENGSANADTRMDRQLGRGKNGTVHGKAKVKEVKVNHLKGVKDGDRYRNVKKRTAKGKNKGNEKERNGYLNEQKPRELDERGANNNNNTDAIVVSSHLDAKNITSDDVKKRKDLEANSSLHEHSMRMTKLARMSPATNTCKADGLEDIKERCYNGITGPNYLEGPIVSVSSSSYSSNEVSLKPPHPDTEYLSKVYSIPALEDSPVHIDQNWLFSGDRADQKTAMSEIAEAPQVWDEAQLIGTADIVALPYVVPL